MTIKSLILGAALLAFAAPSVALAHQSAPALAAVQPVKPDAAPVKQSPAVIYTENHKAAVGVLTQFLALLKTPENTAALNEMTAQTAKLADLEKAYLAAAASHDDAAAKQAAADYKDAVKTIVELASPFEQMAAQLNDILTKNLGPLGPVAEKIVGEQDFKDLQSKINETLAPVNAANEKIGPLITAASAAAKVRMQIMQKQIIDEELTRQITNQLQADLAK